MQLKQLIPQDAVLQPRKLDWLVSDRVDDLIAIMNDNATFVRFPTLGSSASIVTVYGDHTVNVSRTIRSIMQLVCFTPYLGICASNLVVLGMRLLFGRFLAIAHPV